MRTRTLRSFNTGAIDALVDAGDTERRHTAPSPSIIATVRRPRVPIDATAFGIRERHFVVEVLARGNPETMRCRTRPGRSRPTRIWRRTPSTADTRI